MTDPLSVIDHPSPNHGLRRGGGPIDLLILHYTGMLTGAAALARLCDPAAEVSAHYLIEEDGRIFRLVAEAERAWHAGAGGWRDITDINSRSIGIELVNPGHEHGYRGFPPAQMAALIRLARGIIARQPIAPMGVLGHSDVAPARKQDPGELFDWPGLAAAGIGFWPDFDAPTTPPDLDAADALRRIGYVLPSNGISATGPDMVVTAFQRRFRPALFDGLIDAETLRRLCIVAQYGMQHGCSTAPGTL
ncbi:MAG TPA: N-acetylmuramoyl-L-alanine amidase [Stellaceae bacterium]|nr:N-acetylmuramoyl-L-alanine amidase [Stellaceae bacterium]